MKIELGRPGQITGFIANFNNKGLAYKLYGKVAIMIWVGTLIIIWCSGYGFRYTKNETKEQSRQSKTSMSDHDFID